MWVWGQTPYVLLSLWTSKTHLVNPSTAVRKEFPRGLRPHPSWGLVHSSFLHSAPSSSGAYKDRLLVPNLSLTANSYESPCLHPLLRWDSSLLSLPHPLYFLCQVFISCCQFVLISSHQRVGWGPLSLIIWSADLLVPFETEQGTHNFTSEKQLCPWPLLLMRQDPNPNSRPQICCIPEKAVCSLP